jgi:hypothetical protein
MAEPIAGRTIDAQRIILRDDAGRIRGEWFADTRKTSLALLGTDEKPRISIDVEESEHSNYQETFLGQVQFLGNGGKPTMRLQGFNDSANLSLLDENGHIRADLSVMHFKNQDWPQFILSGSTGWRIMLVVHDEVPHIILYDQEDNPRIQMLVKKQGAPRLRR